MGLDEQPVLFTPHTGDVLMHDVTLGQITITNHSDHVSAYVLLIAPKIYVKAAMLPWKQAFSALKSGKLVEQIKQLFGGRPAIPGR